MKRITQTSLLFLVLAGLSFGISSCAKKFKPVLSSEKGVNFKEISLTEAKASAKAENRPLFVFAHASWCPTCKKMEQEVLIKKELGEVYNRKFVNVAIDIDSPEGHRLNALYPIRATPTLFFFNPDGTVAKKLEGFTTVDGLLAQANL